MSGSAALKKQLCSPLEQVFLHFSSPLLQSNVFWCESHFSHQYTALPLFLFSDGVWFDVWHLLEARPNVCTPVTFRTASYFKTTGKTLILYAFEFLHCIVSFMCASAWIRLYIRLIPFKGFLHNLIYIKRNVNVSAFQ